ncbi:MAG: molybdopterin-dependent oxidoreductase [Sciscionella sp.]
MQRRGERPAGRAGGWREGGIAALLGLVAAAFALGVAEFVAGFVGPDSSPVVAVGSAAINLVPGSLKDFAIKQFGSNDKLVLIITVLVVLVVLAAVAGLLARRRLAVGVTLVVLLGVVGVVAAATGSGVVAAVPSAVAAVVGGLALWLLVTLRSRRAVATTEPAAGAPTRSRRAVLATGAGMVVVAAAGVAGGRLLLSSRFDVTASRARIRLPAPVVPAKPLPPGYQFSVPGLSPFRTSNRDFYRVDYDLTLPQVPVEQWSLNVHGSVDRPMQLTFRDLLDRKLIERDMTLCCVSNEIGGPYVSTTRWLGVSLPELLREAGVHSGADQLLSSSVDGMTIGTPTDLIMDGREALIVVGMNGEPLPIAHGFPARLIVPGLYGYASATKWVNDLNLTTFAAEKAYWVRRGYVRDGEARTASRIDVPKPFAQVKPGPATVAGVAWALHRGISTVQFRVDNGPWQETELTTAAGTDLWRQWRTTWQATPGSHQIQVRAADGAGHMQPEHRMGVFPSGATGWHSVLVNVTS